MRPSLHRHVLRAFFAITIPVAAFACGASSTPEEGDASVDGSSPRGDASDGRASFVADPSCKVNPANGCPTWQCRCGTTVSAGVEACVPGEEACKLTCDLHDLPFQTPVECDKITPQRDAAPPPSGKPGGQCIPPRNECYVTSCTCKNGTTIVGRNKIPCVDGVCGTVAEGCEPVCRDQGGWTGEGY